eukprot:CAMPEP_0194281518 /NCGR_PEP_ID=MMETSP0169-20130528/20838_1 /TAXON_ID=218684 /ORGANISM="Corethron pennatum, Strain L29A3" /LENGTH=849 /DNA_ID=CAMNT_0039026591 /DNA_START=83 /DNA_END=2632 /DNA_ORIENTATION=+
MIVLPPRILHLSDDFLSTVTKWAAVLDTADVERDLALLSGVRQRVTDDVTGALQEYHGLLVGLEDRGSLLTNGGVECCWESALEPGRLASRTGTRIERAFVLYSIAARLSLEASRETAADVRAMRLQGGAGVIKYLKEMVIYAEGFPPSDVDISPAALEFYEKILLGQAQGALYGRAAAKGGAGPTVLAKAARGTAVLYEHASRASAGPTLSALLPDAWKFEAQGCAFWYRAMAEYWMSSTVGEAAVMEALCRIKMAEAMVEQGIVAIRRLPEDGTAAVTVEQPIRVRMEKWKDTIVHRRGVLESKAAEGGAPPVKPTDLKPIKAALLVKPAPIPDSLFAYPSSFFLGMLPSDVWPAYSSFVSSSDSLLDRCTGESRSADEEARAALREMKLPAALEHMAGGGGIPSGLWDRIAQIQKDPTFVSLGQGGNQVVAGAAARRITDLITRAEAILDSDVRFSLLHDTFRAPDGSAGRLRKLVVELERMQATLARAREADMVVYNKIMGAEMSEARGWLMKGKTELDGQVPVGTVTEEDRAKMDVRKLKTLLLQLNNLIKNREKVLLEFPKRLKMNRAKLMSELSGIDNVKLEQLSEPHEDIINRAMSSVANVRGEIRSSIVSQEDLLNQIRSENQIFQIIRMRNPAASAQAESFCSKLEAGIQIVLSTLRDVKRGSTFYQGLSTQIDAHEAALSSVESMHLQFRTDFEDAVVGRTNRAAQERVDADVAVRVVAEMVRERKVRAPRAIRDRSEVAPDEGYVPPTLPGAGGGPPPPNFEPALLPPVGGIGPGTRPLPGFGNSPADLTHMVSEVKLSDAQVARMMEMGFELEAVKGALQRHNNNEELALNDLLMS